MLASPVLLLLLALCASAVGFLARGLRRPIPIPLLVLFSLLPILLFPGAFVSSRTPLPLDHAANIHPWAILDHPAPRNANLNDVATQLLPWAKAVRVSWKEGSLPFRNPWNGCGAPLASNSQSAAFSPLTVLTFLLPLARALTLLAAVKLLLAMAGMWLWIRELGASPSSAVFGSVAFALSFAFTPWLFFPNTAVLSLWPWILFLVELCRDPRSRKRASWVLSGVFVLAALAGHPENLALGCLLVSLWLLGRWALSDLRGLGLVARSIAPAAALALGLTAFFLLPSLLAVVSSNRAALTERPFWQPALRWLPHRPAWPEGMLTPVFPHTLGNAVESPMISGGHGSFPEMTLGYFGIVGWAAVLLLFRTGSRRPRAEWVLGALLLCGLGVATASWPFAELAAQIPGIRLMFPLRFYAWIALCGSAIAALELDRYARDLPLRRWTPLMAALVSVLLGSAAVAVYLRFGADHTKAGGHLFQRRQTLLVLGVLALAALFALLTRLRPKLFIAGTTLLGAGELLYQGGDLYRLHSAALLYPETRLLRFLRAQSGTFRVVGEGSVLFPNTAVFAGLQDIRAHDAVERRDYVEFLDATCGYPPAEYFKRIGNVDAPALDFLNVRYLLTDTHTRSPPGAKWRPVYAGADGNVFQNEDVIPRAFLPERVCLVRPRRNGKRTNANRAFGERFAELSSMRDWRSRAYVLADRDEQVANALAEVTEYQESANAAFVRVRVAPGDRDAFVILSLVQDGGWSAEDESGRSVSVLRANGPFFALRVPPGEHRVRLRYWPPGFKTGTAITLLTLGVLVSIAATGARKRRRR